MADKIFSNVRLGLKVDTLENWGKSTLILKKGEVAFATIAASAGLGLTDPVCMMKIGDGDHTFAELGYDFYAKASDVVAAAKSEDALTAFINSVIAGSGLATDGALSTLSGRVDTAEGEIDALQAELDTAETGLKARMTAAEGDISALEGLVGDKKVATQISEAIAELKIGEYAKKTEVEAVQTALGEYQTSNDAKVLEHTNAIAGHTNELAAIKDGTSIDSFADVESALAGKEAAGAAAAALEEAKSYADGLAGDYDAAGSASAAEAAAKAYAKEYADGLAGNYDAAGSAAQALTDAKAYTNEEIEEWVGTKTVGVQISEAITGLKLDETYDAKGAAAAVEGKLNEHAQTASETYETKTDAAGKLTEAKGYTDTEVKKVQDEVDALETYVGQIPAGATATDVIGYIQEKTSGIATDAALGELQAAVDVIEADYLKAADKTELAGDIEALETLVGTTAVATQISTAVAAEKERAEGIESGLDTRVKAIEDDYLVAADKKALQDQIDLIMNNPDTEKVINSISEFTQYIEDHGEIAEGMRTDINKNKEDIATEKSRAEGVESGLDTRLQAVEAAVGETGSVATAIEEAVTEAKKYADDEIKELAEGAVATNAADIEALEAKVGSKTVAEQITDVTNPLDARIVELEKVDHSHANATVLDGIEASDVSAWDAKVDDVTATVGGGLKATRTDNTVAIEIDDSITWVFDCGDAGVTA